MEISRTEVKAGQRVEGRYKRAGREPSELKLAIHAAIVSRGDTMLVATNLKTGALIAVYADCFDPRGVKVSAGVDGDALDVANLFFTPRSRSHGFVELVPPDRHYWAEFAGAVKVSALAVPSASIAQIA